MDFQVQGVAENIFIVISYLIPKSHALGAIGPSS